MRKTIYVISKIGKALSKVSGNTQEPEESSKGWHSEVGISFGFGTTFVDGETTPSSVGFGSIGGGYYDTYTIDLDDVMNDYIHSDFSEDDSNIFDNVNTDAD